MSSTLAISLVGMVLIAGLGFLGRRQPARELSEWTVGGRRFSTATTWFLQAGESFTTFSFLGLAGLAFGGGVAATYALGYLAMSLIGMYFIGPRTWRLGRDHGYLTQADFFTDRYRSPLLGKVVALVGAVFLLPYLQLQITGLGLIVQLATGSRNGSHLSMVVATVLTVAFVLWSGIRGIAKVAYLKDILMVVALVVLLIAVPATLSGGIGHLFHTIQQSHAGLLTIHSGDYDRTWFTTAMLISGIGSGLNTMPHLWPPVLSARSGRALRSNYVWLPLYQVALAIPVIIGFVGVLSLSPDTPGNGVLLTLSHQALPGWVVGVIAVAAAAAAMVPSAAIVMGISTLVSHNLLPSRSERARLRTNHLCVVGASGLALILGIARPDLLANLLLLTYGGLSQLAPATVLALGRRTRLGAVPALLGIVTGVAVLGWLTFGGVDIGTVDAGLIALVPNIAVSAVAQLLLRRRSGATADREAPATVHRPADAGAAVGSAAH
ncbi:sodium:solute symporter family protein [Peterkaempfera bronchialis]|uniref:sodium:solute symporter family protein n=1 Tax=Peterkaempfera bronchialis TaxID=2126346 RepID=UPI003C2DA22A